MNSKTVANFDGLTFLDKLETIFNMKGLEGIIELVEEHFPIGCFMKMNQNIENTQEHVYKIEKVTVSKINPDVVIRTMGDVNSDSIVRSLNLSYVTVPFQIDIYGSIVN
jgi:hypothetical protein